MSLLLPVLKSVTRKRKEISCLLRYANQKRNQGVFNDVSIRTENYTLMANRMVLACYCPYFEQRFSSNIETNLVEIQDIDENLLKPLIEFIYKGEICIDSENVLDLLSGADNLQLHEIKEFCFEFAWENITLGNWDLIYRTACQYENYSLKHKIYEYFTDNFEEISGTKNFKNLDPLELFPYLYNLNRQLISQSILCESLINWTKHEEFRRMEYLNRYIKFVAIQNLPLEFLNKMFIGKLFPTNLQCLHKLRSRLDYLLSIGSKVLSIGGFCTLTKVNEIYSLTENTPETYPQLPISIHGHCSLQLGTCIYCIGGYCNGSSDQTWRLNLNSLDRKWEKMTSMNCKRSVLGGTKFGDVLVVCGGYENSNDLKTTEVYNPRTNEWKTIKASLNQKRRGNHLIECDGALYSLGGVRKSKFLNSVERLKSLTGAWVKVSSMKTPRGFFAVAKLDGLIYVIGGETTNYKCLNTVEIYDVSTECWSDTCPMKQERSYHCACVMQGKIYVFGGYNRKKEIVRDIECFDPKTKNWVVLRSIQTEFVRHSLVVL